MDSLDEYAGSMREEQSCLSSVGIFLENIQSFLISFQMHQSQQEIRKDFKLIKLPLIKN